MNSFAFPSASSRLCGELLRAIVLLACCSTVAHASQRHFPTDFRKADSIAAMYPKHSLKDIRTLAIKLTQPLSTEEEKFRAIYKWVCINIDYDYPLHEENQRQRSKMKTPGELKEWSNKFSIRVLTVLLEKQRTVCTGYASLIRELAYHAGLPCLVIDGYGRTAQANIGGEGVINHSWNAVQLHGQWYLCDPTWSSGAYDTQLSEYVRQYHDEYFLAEPEIFIRNHYPLDSSWILLDHKPTLNEFLNRPLIYVHAYSYDIVELFPATFDITVLKGEKVSFRFRSGNDKVIEKIELLTKRLSTVKEYAPKFSRSPEGWYDIEHVFTMKGTHAVHVLIDRNYVATFSVEVR